jgi:nucleoside 2-deoxyribosyltransferase
VTLDPSDEGADSELRRAVFEQNILALIESDAVVLVQPCGVSAAIELGFAIGRDKYTVVLNAPDGRPELMLRAADQIVTSIEDLVDYFFTLEHTMGTLEDDQAARQC